MVAAKVKMNANGAHTFLEVEPQGRIQRNQSVPTLYFFSDRQNSFRDSSPPALHVLRFPMYPHGLRISPPFVSTSVPYHRVFFGFLLTEQTNSWRSSNSQRPNRYEHHRLLFPPPNRYRRLRRLWRLTRYFHMRLGTYNHLIHRDLPVPRENIVHSPLLSWAPPLC